MTTPGDPRNEILAVLDHYATALDRRDWRLLDRVFTEDPPYDAGELAATRYEMGGEYRDPLCRTPQDWRIRHRTLEVLFETGSRDVLRPAP